MTIHFDFEQKNSVYTTSSGEILVLPEKDFDFDRLEFDSIRKNDYEFSYRYYISSTTALKLPPGYTVKKLPEKVEVTNENYEFRIQYEFSDGTVKQTKSIKIKNFLLKKSLFNQWNHDIKALKAFYNSPVILSAK